MRFDFEERWAKAVLLQQARRRGLTFIVHPDGKKVYCNAMPRSALCEKIHERDVDPANLNVLKRVAAARGIEPGKRNQRQLLAALRKHDDEKPLQPELIDISYASASEAEDTEQKSESSSSGEDETEETGKRRERERRERERRETERRGNVSRLLFRREHERERTTKEKAREVNEQRKRSERSKRTTKEKAREVNEEGE
jgi:hypothetical protein